MENQHRLIAGYRDLSPDEIAAMNRVKELGAQVGDLCDELRANSAGADIDQRWVSIGTTNLQQGFMALVRAIARPSTF